MVEDLLREFVAEPWVERLDFSTAERLNASYVSPRYSHREGDMVWKIETVDGTPVYLYILLEFQSSSDPYMPLRGMTYKCLFYQDLIAHKRLTPSGKLPPVIVIFLYNGEEPWRGPLELSDLIERIDPSAEIYVPRLRCRLIDESLYGREVLDRSPSPVASLFRLERSLGPQDMRESVVHLVEALKQPEDRELRRAFQIWLGRRLEKKGIALPEAQELEEMPAMLEKRMEEWSRQQTERAWQKGRQEGEAKLLVAQLEQKFGPLDEVSRMRIRSADSERLLEWGKRFVEAQRLADVLGD
jgi:putative YhgA-like transposase